MILGENGDPLLLEAVEIALQELGPGDVMVICPHGNCEAGPRPCPMCARITVVEGMAAADVVDLAKPARA